MSKDEMQEVRSTLHDLASRITGPYPTYASTHASTSTRRRFDASMRPRVDAPTQGIVLEVRFLVVVMAELNSSQAAMQEFNSVAVGLY